MFLCDGTNSITLPHYELPSSSPPKLILLLGVEKGRGPTGGAREPAGGSWPPDQSVTKPGSSSRPMKEYAALTPFVLLALQMSITTTIF